MTYQPIKNIEDKLVDLIDVSEETKVELRINNQHLELLTEVGFEDHNVDK